MLVPILACLYIHKNNYSEDKVHNVATIKHLSIYLVENTWEERYDSDLFIQIWILGKQLSYDMYHLP